MKRTFCILLALILCVSFVPSAVNPVHAAERDMTNAPAYEGLATASSPLHSKSTDLTGRTFTPDKLLAVEKPLANTPRTMEAWVCFSPDMAKETRGGVILGNYYEVNRNVISFEIYSGGAPRLYSVNENGKVTNLIFSNVSVYNGAWNHIAIVLDDVAGKAHCYLNGKLAQTLPLSVPPQLPATCLALGGDYRYGNSQYFKGQIYSVNLYDSVRDESAILRDMAGFGGIAMAAWDLHQSADSYKDLSPHSYHISLSDAGRAFYAGEHNVVSKSFPSVPNTVEALICFPSNTPASTRGGVILGNYKDGSRGVFSVEIYTNGNPRLYYIDSAGTVVNKLFHNVNVYTGSWLHLAIVHDSSAQKAHCYINGTLAQTLDLNIGSFAPATPLVVGGDCRTNNTQYFKGQLRSVAVYADARTQAEITADKTLMGNGDPMAYWDLAVEGDRYADLSNNGYPIVRTQEGPDFRGNDTYQICKGFSAMPKTLEAWVCFPQTTDPSTRGGVILGNYPGNWKGLFNFEIHQKGRPRLYYKAPDGTVTDAIFHEVNVYTGQWVHLAVVQDVAGKALRCYVDGNLAQTLSMTVPDYIPTGTLYAGGDSRDGNEQFFKGRLRAVCLYSNMRTEAEIKGDRSQLGSGAPMACWNMVSPADSYSDLSGKGYHINRSALWLTGKNPVRDYDFTFVAVGDTQIVARKDMENGTQKMNRIYEWILSQKEAQNIQYVMGLGDITDGNTWEEWQIAKNAICQLDGKIPYSLVRGNHDGSDKINATFHQPPYSTSYQGSFDGTLNNTWRTILAGSNKIPYLIMTLDYGPTDQVLSWADRVVRDHPDHNVIITTHAYLFRDGTTLDSSDVCPPSSSGSQHNNGDQIWEKFAKKHKNIVMVLSGHDPSGKVVVNQAKGESGNVVTQFLIDPQGVDTTILTGAVALLHFSADGRKVEVEYYSTLQEAYFMTENQFSLSVEVMAPPAKKAISIGHTLNLQNDITLNYGVSKKDLEGYDSCYLECRIPQYEGNTLVGTKTLRLEPEDRGNYFYFLLNGLTAIHMNDEVQATLCMTKGGIAYTSETDRYSIAKYAYNQLNKADAPLKLKNLCAELLRYGKETQIFKGYRTNALADASMTATHRAYLSDLNVVTFGNHNQILQDISAPSITWAGKSLSLDSKVSMKYVFALGSYTGKVEDLILKVRYVNHAGVETQTVVTNPVLYRSSDNTYAFTFDGLLAAELRTVLDAAIYKGNTQLSQTLRYSPDTYGNGKTGQLLILCKALFAYSDSAKAYFGN